MKFSDLREPFQKQAVEYASKICGDNASYTEIYEELRRTDFKIEYFNGDEELLCYPKL